MQVYTLSKFHLFQSTFKMNIREDQDQKSGVTVGHQNWTSNPVPVKIENNQHEVERVAGTENPVSTWINMDYPNFPPGIFLLEIN